MRQLVYTIFIINNHNSFHLWWKENLVKHQKVSKYYDWDCSNKNVNFATQFCLGSISNKFNYVDAEEISLKGNVYDFSVDYNSIDKSDIHKYLMVQNNIK